MSGNIPAVAAIVIGIVALLLCLFGYKIRRIICALQGIVVGAFAGYIINILVSISKLAGKSESFISKFEELIIVPSLSAFQTLINGLSTSNAVTQEASRELAQYFESLRNLAGSEISVYIIVCAVIMFVLHLIFPKIMYALDTGAATWAVSSVPAMLVVFAHVHDSGLTFFDGSHMLFYMPILAGLAVAIISYAVFEVEFILATAIGGGFTIALCAESLTALSMNGFFTLAFFLSLIGIICQLLLLRNQKKYKALKKALRAKV